MKLTEYLIKNAGEEWDKLVNHPFGKKLCTNKLARPAFVNYLIQDELYLIDYLKGFGLLLAKARTPQERHFAVECITEYNQSEITLQTDLMSELRDANQWTKKSLTCSAYTSWFYEIFVTGDWLDLLVALAPCTIGYYFFGKNLNTDNNLSKLTITWINFYQGEAMLQSYKAFKNILDANHITELSPQRLAKLVKIFQKGVWLENQFFNNTIQNQ